MPRRKLTLLLLGAALVLLLLLIAGVQESHLFRVNLKTTPIGPGTLKAQGMTTGTSGSTVQTSLVKPHFTGQDTAGTRWDIRADSATQSTQLSTEVGPNTPVNPADKENKKSLSESVITLTNITASYLSGGEKSGIVSATTPAEMTLTARQGTYVSNTLKLTDHVVMQGRGYTITTQALTADMSTRMATGNQGVQVVRDGTTLNGDNFTVDQKTGRVTLSGNVTARFTPGAK